MPRAGFYPGSTVRCRTPAESCCSYVRYSYSIDPSPPWQALIVRVPVLYNTLGRRRGLFVLMRVLYRRPPTVDRKQERDNRTEEERKRVAQQDAERKQKERDNRTEEERGRVQYEYSCS